MHDSMTMSDGTVVVSDGTVRHTGASSE